jgi:hypothetical protein
MKIINVEHTVYQFSELSEDAKAKAISEYLESQDYRADIFKEYVIENLENSYGLENLDTTFSLSYSQGDGLCIFGKITETELYGEKFRSIAFEGIDEADVVPFQERECIWEVEFHKFTHHYNHEKTVEISIDNCCELTQEEGVIADKMLENIKKWYFKFCKEWKKNGYEFFYEMDENYFTEICEANDYWFKEDGSLF